MEQPKLIWVLEDDEGAQFVYEEILGGRYRLRLLSTVEELKSALKEEPGRPDLLIADLKLPGQSFLNFLATEESAPLREMRFIVISSVDEHDALRQCFQDGAADYITKPFGKGELSVKVERLMEGRAHNPLRPGEIILDGRPVNIDPGSLKVWVGAASSPLLTAKEFQILTLMQSAPDFTITREGIINRVWGNVKVGSKTLDVHLFNLRKKLNPLGVDIAFLPPGQYRLSTRSGAGRV